MKGPRDMIIAFANILLGVTLMFVELP